MKIYYNWCWDGHIKIIEDWTEIWMEYSFLVDTDTKKNHNWRIEFWEFDKYSMKLNHLIAKWLKLDLQWDVCAYLYKWHDNDYYMLEWPKPTFCAEKLKQILLRKELWDFIIKNKLNNDIFFTKENVDEVILNIYNDRVEPIHVIDRYIKE